MIRSAALYTDENLSVRPFGYGDDRAIYELLSNSRSVGEVPVIPSIEFAQFSSWLGRAVPGHHRFIAQADRGIVGLVILAHNLRPRLHHSGTISLIVSDLTGYEPARHALMSAALEMADNWLNLSRIQLDVPATVQSDIEYFKSIGFVQEGTRVKALFRDGLWVDLLRMARLRGQFQGSGQPAEINKPGRQRNQDPIAMDIGKVEIRPVVVDDAQAIHDMLRDPAICRTTLQLPSQELSQVEDKLQAPSQWLHRFAAVAGGQVVGSISLVQKDIPGYSHIGHIGMKVHPSYWNLGIGTQLVESITSLADKWLNIIRIELEVHTDNPAGIRLYQKCGFVIEGTMHYQAFGAGRWADSYFMARIKET